MSGGRMIIVAAAVAACLAGVAGATAGLQAPSRVHTQGARAKMVFYQLKAEFGLGLDVKWTWDEGSRASGCGWTHREGTWEVDAGSVSTLPGSIRFSTRWWVTPSQGWALLAAVGQAKAEVKRTLVQEGRTSTSTGGCKNEVFAPTDCGTHEYTTRVATLTADWRDNAETLESRTTAPAQGRLPAIVVSVPPLRALYRSCDLPPFVPMAAGLPGDIGILAHPEKLAAMKPGWRYRAKTGPSAKGSCAKKLPEGVTCTYTLDVHVVIHRLTKKEIDALAKKKG